MKPFFALYVKELKANKTLFLFLLLLIVGMSAYGVIGAGDDLDFEIGKNFIDIDLPWLIIAAFILVFSMPFLLAHTFNTEWKSETHYQMFALPVSQYTIILAKIAAVASKGIVGGIIVIGCVSLWLVHGVLPYFAFLAALVLVTYMVFILGVVTGMEGMKFSVKRYRGLNAVGFFIIAVFLYGWLFSEGTEFFEFSGEISMSPYAEFTIDLAPFVYTILMGVIFMIIGLVMYEKRAEI